MKKLSDFVLINHSVTGHCSAFEDIAHVFIYSTLKLTLQDKILVCFWHLKF
jgi:hypothetical protein